jgi:hypothetical protein
MAERRSLDGDIFALSKKRQHIRNYEARKSTIKWIGIIIVVAIVTIVLINVIPPLFTKIDLIDTAYRPRDVERQYHQIQKMREGEPDKAEKGNWQQLRKK